MQATKDEAEELFAELISSLTGATTAYREPLSGAQGVRRSMTRENMVSMALAYSRKGQDDYGPEVAYSIFAHRLHREEFIIREGVNDLLRSGGHIASRNRGRLGAVVSASLRMLVFSDWPEPAPVERVKRKDYDFLRSLSSGLLWNAGIMSLQRAAISFTGRLIRRK